MPFVSITRLRIRSARFLPRFAWMTLRSRAQLRRAAGFSGGALLADRGLTFWTMTAWDGPESMRAYMTSGPHRAAMPLLMDWCDEASVVHWTQGADALPTWAEADGRMRAEGRPSKVRHPSAAHAAMGFGPPRTVGSAAIRPAPA